MNEETILELAARTTWLSVQIAAPALIAALVVGLVISIFQAATQINEQTMSFIPKILAMVLALVICGPWIIQKMMSFTITLIQEIPTLAH